MDNLYLLEIAAMPKGQAERTIAGQSCVQHIFEVGSRSQYWTLVCYCKPHGSELLTLAKVV